MLYYKLTLLPLSHYCFSNIPFVYFLLPCHYMLYLAMKSLFLVLLVIDFLYFSLINFLIFNVEDIYVCVSTGMFLLLLLFYYKEEDLERIMGKKSKQEYVSDIIEKIQESKKVK